MSSTGKLLYKPQVSVPPHGYCRFNDKDRSTPSSERLTTEPIGSVFLCDCGQGWVVRRYRGTEYHKGKWRHVRWYHLNARRILQIERDSTNDLPK